MDMFDKKLIEVDVVNDNDVIFYIREVVNKY